MKNLKETIEYKKHGFQLVTCPICGKETLNNFWVCETCGWEYDGFIFEDEYSDANGCTVAEYRANFMRCK